MFIKHIYLGDVMKRKRLIYLTAFLAVIIVFCSTCFSDYTGEGAIITLHLGRENSRTSFNLQDDDYIKELKHTIEFSGPFGENFTLEAGDGLDQIQVQVDSGRWTIKVTAAHENYPHQIAEGSVIRFIRAGINNHVDIIMNQTYFEIDTNEDWLAALSKIREGKSKDFAINIKADKIITEPNYIVGDDVNVLIYSEKETGSTIALENTKYDPLLTIGYYTTEFIENRIPTTVTIKNIILEGHKDRENIDMYSLIKINEWGTFIMEEESKVINALGRYGGGVNVEGLFIMKDGSSISGNFSIVNGGGVYVSKYSGGYREDRGIFYMAGGIIYGMDEGDELSNMCVSANTLAPSYRDGGALYVAYDGIAEYGSFVNGQWVKSGDILSSGQFSDDTITVINGELQ